MYIPLYVYRKNKLAVILDSLMFNNDVLISDSTLLRAQTEICRRKVKWIDINVMK